MSYFLIHILIYALIIGHIWTVTLLFYYSIILDMKCNKYYKVTVQMVRIFTSILGEPYWNQNLVLHGSFPRIQKVLSIKIHKNTLFSQIHYDCSSLLQAGPKWDCFSARECYLSSPHTQLGCPQWHTFDFWLFIFKYISQ